MKRLKINEQIDNSSLSSQSKDFLKQWISTSLINSLNNDILYDIQDRETCDRFIISYYIHEEKEDIYKILAHFSNVNEFHEYFLDKINFLKSYDLFQQGFILFNGEINKF